MNLSYCAAPRLSSPHTWTLSEASSDATKRQVIVTFRNDNRRRADAEFRA